jgi:hypothetical protein
MGYLHKITLFVTGVLITFVRIGLAQIGGGRSVIISLTRSWQIPNYGS